MNKYIKNEQEQKLLQQAANIAVNCLHFIFPLLQVGIKEIQIVDSIKQYFIDQKCDGLSFEPIVAFGKNAANPHHQSDETKLCENDLVEIDLGCVWKGYCSDITRTFLPKKYSVEQEKIYQLVLQANQLAINSIQMGMQANQIDQICRNYLVQNGYGKYFIHTTGHGIGKIVHEGFSIGPKDETILQEGMCFTIEPGIYLVDQLGIRIEDTVLIKDGKIQILTSGFDKKIITWGN